MIIPPNHYMQSNGKQYCIEKLNRVICFGSPGYVDRWEIVDRHQTAEARDAALANWIWGGKVRAFDYDPLSLRVT